MSALSRADLPAILDAVKSFREVVANPPELRTESGELYSKRWPNLPRSSRFDPEAIHQAGMRVRARLSPSDPTATFSEDLHDPDLPPDVADNLSKLWRKITRTQWALLALEADRSSLLVLLDQTVQSLEVKQTDRFAGRLRFDEATWTVYINGTPHNLGDPKTFQLYRTIAEAQHPPISSAKIRHLIPGLSMNKAISNRIKSLPEALRETVKSGRGQGYWIELCPEIPKVGRM